MANVKEIKQKPITIKLGGKVRTFRFDMNAFAGMEEAFGSVDKAFAAMDKGSFVAIRKLLHLGFAADDPELTEQALGAMIDVTNMKDVMETLGKAFQEAMPQEKAVAVGAKAKK